MTQRPIKFRAWHFKHKRMFSSEEMTTDQMALLPDGHFANIHSASTRLSQIFSHDEMLPLQFTGLKDKKHKEIFEGDIVETINESGRFTYQVQWEKYNCCFEFVAVNFDSSMPMNMGSIYTEVSVIGNIWENPELLNVKA